MIVSLRVTWFHLFEALLKDWHVKRLTLLLWLLLLLASVYA